MPRTSPPRVVSPLRVTGVALALAATTSGCAEWPRHAHLPAVGDTGALPAGADPGSVVPITWAGPTTESEAGTANGLPVPSPVQLSAGEGQLVEGVLDGTGWDGDSAPDRDGSCGTLAFPVGGGGSYSGDVDWVAVAPQTSGYLCVTVELDRDAQFDLVPYRLDDCDEPTSVVADGQGEPLGYDQGGGGATWTVPVQAGDRLGIALGAFWPQDDGAQKAWRIGLSITDSTLCPTLPEAG